MTGITAIAAGADFGVALKSDGTVWGWGSALGNGTGGPSATPVQVSGLSAVIQIAAAYELAMALKSDGSMWQWGWDSYNQVINLTPVRIQASFAGATALALAGGHTLALKSDGTVWAWGRNDYGQLGNGTTNGSSTPVQASGLTGVTRIAAGCGCGSQSSEYGYSLAVKSDGTAWAWGYNGSGQLGNGTHTSSSSPVQVSGLSSITAVMASISSSFGGDTSMAIRSNDGSVWTWGDNRNGQLGNGNTTASSTPVQVTNLTGVLVASIGDLHAVAAKSDGTAWAWGANANYQLGDGITLDSHNAIVVDPLIAQVTCSAPTQTSTVAAGQSWSVAVKPDGTVWQWGSRPLGRTSPSTAYEVNAPVQVMGLSGVIGVTAGDNHVVALKSDGSVWTWGYNGYGQLGNGTITNSATPVQVGGLTGVVQIGASANESAALTSDGTLWQWGWDSYLQGQNNWQWIQRTAPQKVAGLSGVAVMAQGTGNAAVVRCDGSVWDWGFNGDGQLGVGAVTDPGGTPQRVNSLSGATQVAVGSYFSYPRTAYNSGSVDSYTVAVKADGTAWAWGFNYQGELGNGTRTNSSTPVQVTGLTNVRTVATYSVVAYVDFINNENGFDGSVVAAKSDGTTWAWGDNTYGELGNGTKANSSVPVQVSNLTRVASVAMGNTHALAESMDGMWWSWGSNGYGELGNGTTLSITTPGYVVIPPTGGALTSAEYSGGGNPSECLWCKLAQQSGGTIDLPVRASAADPISTADGSFYESLTDISIPGRGPALDFARTYSSVSATIASSLGYGWTFDYNVSLAVNTQAGTATLNQENGSQVTFTLVNGAYTAPARVLATLVHNGDGTYSFVRDKRTTMNFSAFGQLNSVVDLNGYTTSLTYSGSQLTTITDTSGRSLAIAWTGSHITGITDANLTPNRTVSFQYNDGNGNLTDAFDVNSGHWQFGYDANHRLTSVKDPRCYASGCPGVQNTYDGSGRVTSQKDQLNRQTTFDFTSIPGGTKVTDAKGNVRVDYYQYGERVATTRGYGTGQAATTYVQFDPNSVGISVVTDPNGHFTRSTFDASGNLLTITDPLSRITTNSYDALNDLRTRQDPIGVITTFSYDSRGNLTSQSTPLVGTSQVQTTTYNHADSIHPGDVTSTVDPDSKTWTYGFDANGYQNSITDPLGDQSTWVYNADGWLISSVTAKGNVAGCGCAAQYTSRYSYNPFGQRTGLTDPNGHTTAWHYDADRNLDRLTDADSNVTTYTYDSANELIQVKRADSPQTTLTTDYNSDGSVLDQKDGKNNAILTYSYDSLGRVATTMDALNNVTSYTYDGADNQLTKQDPGGNCGNTPKVACTSLAYDAGNELTSITYSDGVTPNVSNIGYDGDGQRTTMTDGTGTSTWTWDSLHRLTKYVNGNGVQVQWLYNLRNLATTITYPGSLSVTRGYDDAGRWTSAQDWNSNSTTFGYDPNSNLTTETLPAASGIVDTFTFNIADQLTGVSDVKGGNTLFAATYGRDSADQLASDSSAPASANAFRYTPLNQLCYAASNNNNGCASPPSGGIGYSYDAADNLIQMGNNWQSFNAADQLCWTAATSGPCGSPPSGATLYSFDNRGNRIGVAPSGGVSTTLGYDQANRLVSYSTSAVTTYSYNGDGLRMSKTAGGTTTQYLWDVSGGLSDLLKDGSTAYIYGPGGLPLEQVTGTAVYFLHQDQLGSTRLLTDSSGAIQATYTYDPYGNLFMSTGSIVNPIRFAGQYQDPESGLYYLRARYYDPTSSVFTSRDPLVDQTREPYAYVSDSPINTRDPSGLYSTLTDAGADTGSIIDPNYVPSIDPLPVTDSADITVYLFLSGCPFIGGLVGISFAKIGAPGLGSRGRGKLGSGPKVGTGGGGAEHKGGPPSLLPKHQKGQAAQGRDAGGEKGDARRRRFK